MTLDWKKDSNFDSLLTMGLACTHYLNGESNDQTLISGFGKMWQPGKTLTADAAEVMAVWSVRLKDQADALDKRHSSLLRAQAAVNLEQLGAFDAAEEVRGGHVAAMGNTGGPAAAFGQKIYEQCFANGQMPYLMLFESGTCICLYLDTDPETWPEQDPEPDGTVNAWVFNQASPELDEIGLVGLEMDKNGELTRSW